MGKLKSERERRLQKKLIPLNLFVCILALVAAVSLFILPILKIDAGKMLRNEGVVEFVDEKIDSVIADALKGSEQEGIDYTPVVALLVKQVLGSAEGKISVSGLSAFRVYTGSGDKTQMVMDELLFGDNALATTLINSVVDGVANIFKTDEGKDLLEEAVVSLLVSQLVTDAGGDEIENSFTQDNVKEMIGILSELCDPQKVPDGDVGQVADKLIEKIDEVLGDEFDINDDVKASITNQVQEVYDTTVENLKEGETLSMEALVCVTLSENLDLSKINIGSLLDSLLDESESSVPKHTVDEEADGGQDGSEDVADGEQEGSVNIPDGGQEDTSSNTIVTNYDDLLLEIGYDEQTQNELKEKMRTKLNELLNGFIADHNIDTYLGYYEYIFFVTLAFAAPWLILFLFSFFHMMAKNKRFMMWYVKLFGWIPALFWLVFKLLPIAATKISILNEFWNGENSVMIKAFVSSVGSWTWICGLCYVLLWLVSIFWAFPIKHKIRKERKHPEVEDAYDDDGYDDYDDYDGF